MHLKIYLVRKDEVLKSKRYLKIELKIFQILLLPVIIRFHPGCMGNMAMRETAGSTFLSVKCLKTMALYGIILGAICKLPLISACFIRALVAIGTQAISFSQSSKSIKNVVARCSFQMGFNGLSAMD